MSTVTDVPSPPQVDPREFARQIGRASDAELELGMQSQARNFILDEIFGRMEQHFRADRAGDLRAVIHWKLFDRPEGGYDHYEVSIRAGACTVTKEPREKPDVTLKLKPAHFLKLVTGNADGRMLFLKRQLRIDGDVRLAARMQKLFQIPR